jgi:hypothetical protein
MRAIFICLALILVSSSSALAQTFLLTGTLDEDGEPASGVFTLTLSILDDEDDVVWTEELSGVVVVDGNYAVDVGALEPLPLTVPAGAQMQVTVDGDALEPFPLGSLVRVSRAARAGQVASAPTADLLAGAAAGAVLTRTALATPGQAVVPFSALSGVPADIADGDQGTVISGAGVGLTFSEQGQLAVGDVPGDRFADDALSGDAFAGNSIPVDRIQNASISGAKVGGDLNRLSFQPAPNSLRLAAAKVAGTSLFLQPHAGCALEPGSLVTAATCTTVSCTTGDPPFQLVRRRSCAGVCGQTSSSTCTNTPVGTLVAP